MEELDEILGIVPATASNVPAARTFNSNTMEETLVGKELGLPSVIVHGIEVIPKSNPARSTVPERNFDRHKFCEFLSLGKTEEEALDLCNVIAFGSENHKDALKMSLVVQLRVKDDYFEDMVKEAKKLRADHWFNGIIKSVAKDVDKDAVPAEKLKFEQRKYLAAIDNPDKYSEKKASVDLNVNVFGELKRMKASDAKKIIEEFDPFIDAEFEEVREWSSDHIEGVEGDEEWASAPIEE